MFEITTSTRTDKDESRPTPGPCTTLKLIILSGRSGSGKSSTAYEICHLLRSQKVSHTHIDGDNLNAFYPKDASPNMMLLNFKLMWDTYWTYFRINCGDGETHKLLVVILSGTGMILHLKGIVNVFTGVVNDEFGVRDMPIPVGIEVYPIVLEARDETVEKRLRVREIGGELDEHLVSSSRMNQILGETQQDGIKRFVNEGDNVTVLAIEILKHLGIEI